MSTKLREPKTGRDWLAVNRCLILLKRLSNGPATSEELIAEVLSELGPEAYSPEPKARGRAFKRDRENLRRQFGVELSYSQQQKTYQLTAPSPLTQIKFSRSALQGLHILIQTFEEGTFAESSVIRAFFDEVVQQLVPNDRNLLEQGRQPFEIDLQQEIDLGKTSQRVWHTLERAIREGRRLSFHYLSPQQADRQPRYHEVAAYRIRFRLGHWYLYACDLFWRNPQGFEKYDLTYRNFRLSYILDDEKLAVLPTRLPPIQRTPPRYIVHYRLLPALARGSISRHFNEMRVEYLPDGSAEIHAVTNDAWEAVRILLSYGENCIVLGGEEVRAQIESRIRKMAANYGL
ncbi:MAG: WYL domain-containing protein [Chloroflexi bacterium]|nr:WYL domain-containing protein [Chloroflexota bacterium]